MSADDILFSPMGEITTLSPGFHFLHLDENGDVRLVDDINNANQVVHCSCTSNFTEIKSFVITLGPTTREAIDNFMETHIP